LIVIVNTGAVGSSVAVTSLFALMVNVQVLVPQPVASPVPSENTPGVDGVGAFDVNLIEVPADTVIVHEAVPSGDPLLPQS
jgi:hypothetical protein